MRKFLRLYIVTVFLFGLISLSVADKSLALNTDYEFVSLGYTGSQVSSGVHPYNLDVSSDGRYIVFSSQASNAVRDDTNGKYDVFVRDRLLNTTVRASVATNGTQGNNDSLNGSISDDGRFVVFESSSTNLIAGDTNGMTDIFIRDLQSNTTSLISASSSGIIGNGNNSNARISRNGRYVVFQSGSNNLLPGVPVINNYFHVYRKDILTGVLEPVDVNMNGQFTNNFVGLGTAISCDGNMISFSTKEYTLVTGDTPNSYYDVYLRNMSTSQTRGVTLGANGESIARQISCDGRYVAYTSAATNLVNNDANGNIKDAYLFDTLTNQTELISKSSSGTQGEGVSSVYGISHDGRFVLFDTISDLSGTMSQDTNGTANSYVRDRTQNSTKLMSYTYQDKATTTANGFLSTPSAMSGDARYVAFITNDKFALNQNDQSPFDFDILMNRNPKDIDSPTVTATPSGVVSSYGWYNQSVLITWTATDANGASQPPQTIASLEGTNTYTSGQSCDPSSNCSTGTITLSLDSTQPTINYTSSVSANVLGWFNQDITIYFSCEDALSGISACTGPTILGEGANQSVTGSATDKADNQSTTSITGINIDKTSPTISASLSANANTRGWLNHDVTISFNCNDLLSGVLTCTNPVSLSEGANQSAVGNVVDKASNINAVTVAGINIDKTIPQINASLNASANVRGWFNHDIQASFNCSDSLSGILSCSTPVTIGEGSNQSATGTATDNADNQSTGVVTGVNVDKTLPSISSSLNAQVNARGWFNSDVTVSFSCDDLLSGVLACSNPVTLQEGVNQAVTGIAKDNADNESSYAQLGINIDKTAPTISASLNAAANSYGWFNSDVIVSFSCGDLLSGILSCTNPITLGEGQNQTANGTSTDNADNQNTTSIVGINIDKTPGIVANLTLSNTLLVLVNNSTTVTADTSDGLSGIVSGELFLDTDPGTGNGTAMTYANGQINKTLTLSGLSIGNHTINVRSQDKAGNWSSVQSASFFYLGL